LPDRDEGAFEPRIVAFLCRWCAYAAADGAGSARLPVPPGVLPVRVMCSGRVEPRFVVEAFLLGADGVLVCGCHPGDCHYHSGNLHARSRFGLFASVLEAWGIDRRRCRLEWVGASESHRFSALTEEMTETVRRLGPLRLGREGDSCG
jgi:coenzyme F420-reducing hydrogenase delta subunit